MWRTVEKEYDSDQLTFFGGPSHISLVFSTKNISNNGTKELYNLIRKTQETLSQYSSRSTWQKFYLCWRLPRQYWPVHINEYVMSKYQDQRTVLTSSCYSWKTLSGSNMASTPTPWSVMMACTLVTLPTIIPRWQWRIWMQQRGRRALRK